MAHKTRVKQVAQKVVKRGRGRPPSGIDWKGIGVRFTPEEKASVVRVARKVGLAQAEFIRRATLLSCRSVEKTGVFEQPKG